MVFLASRGSWQAGRRKRVPLSLSLSLSSSLPPPTWGPEPEGAGWGALAPDLLSAASFALTPEDWCLRFLRLAPRVSPAAARRGRDRRCELVGVGRRLYRGVPFLRASLAFLDLSSGVVQGRWGAFGAPAFIEEGRVVGSSPSPRQPESKIDLSFSSFPLYKEILFLNFNIYEKSVPTN